MIPRWQTDPVKELLDPNYAEYQDLDAFCEAKFRRPCEKAPATKALAAGVVIIAGIYFVGFWVIPFFKALWDAQK